MKSLAEVLIQVLYLETSKFLSPSIRLLLKTVFLFTNILKGYYHQILAAGTKFHLNQTFMKTGKS